MCCTLDNKHRFTWVLLLSLILCCAGYSRAELSLLEVQRFRNQEIESYPELAGRLQASWTIPGLSAYFVPQGIAQIPDTNWFLLSGYQATSTRQAWRALGRWPFVRRQSVMEERRAVVILVEHPNGKPVRVGLLHDAPGRPLSLHAGGVAIHGNYFWIPAYQKLYRFPLQPLLQTTAKETILQTDIDPISVDSRGSFASTWRDYLLIGDFARKGSHPVPLHHATPHGGKDHPAWTIAFIHSMAVITSRSTRQKQIS